MTKLTLTRLRDEDGTERGFAVVMQDVTERLASEEALVTRGRRLSLGDM